MNEQFYTPAIAAKVTLVSEDIQRSLRSRFGEQWEHPIGVERNGRWLFSESDLIALTSYGMHLANQTSANQASHYAALLRKGLNADPNTDAVTITVGQPGDRMVVPAAVPFDALAKSRLSTVHFNLVINVAALRDHVRGMIAVATGESKV
jgi:hypothetical protein